MSESSKTQPARIRINYRANNPDNGQFVQFPRWWVDDFFQTSFRWNGTNTKKGHTRCENVPASFWKYLFYLWRHLTHITADNPDYHCSSGIRQFPVRPTRPRFVLWAGAASGVVCIKSGGGEIGGERQTVLRVGLQR